MAEQRDDSEQADDGERLADAEPADDGDPGDGGDPGDDGDPVDGGDPADRRRTELIAAAQARWVAALTDLGGRNTLLYYKDRRAGTLDLAAADPAAVDRFLRTGSARLTRLFHDVDSRADAIRRVQVIYRKARELLEERGIRAGYLAVGIARWDELFLEPAAPVLLRGLTITPTRARHDDFELVLDDDYEVNPVLLYKLASVFGAATEELAEQPASQVGPLLGQAAEAAEVPGFAITDRRVIGTFTYAKLPMVRDLQAAAELLNDSDVVAAIAGDPVTQESLGAADPAIGEATGPLLDSPEEDYSVLDADSSQRSAIGAVLAGRSLVIHGPPGTGKSQTIANLIATLVARGRKVLFVAEKRAAIDAVLSRLKGVGLGGMVLDIHEGTRDRLRIARDLGDTLDEAQRTPAPDLTDLHRRLVDRQQRLSQHATALHDVHKPWGLTPFEVQAALLGGPDEARTPVRLAGPEQITREAADRIRDELHEFAHLGGFTLRPGSTPWYGAALRTPDQARQACDVVAGLSSHELPALLHRVARAGARGRAGRDHPVHRVRQAPGWPDAVPVGPAAARRRGAPAQRGRHPGQAPADPGQLVRQHRRGPGPGDQGRCPAAGRLPGIRRVRGQRGRGVGPLRAEQFRGRRAGPAGRVRDHRGAAVRGGRLPGGLRRHPPGRRQPDGAGHRDRRGVLPRLAQRARPGPAARRAPAAAGLELPPAVVHQLVPESAGRGGPAARRLPAGGRGRGAAGRRALSRRALSRGAAHRGAAGRTALGAAGTG